MWWPTSWPTGGRSWLAAGYWRQELGRGVCYEVTLCDVAGVKGRQLGEHKALHGNHSKMEMFQLYLLGRRDE